MLYEEVGPSWNLPRINAVISAPRSGVVREQRPVGGGADRGLPRGPIASIVSHHRIGRIFHVRTVVGPPTIEDGVDRTARAEASLLRFVMIDADLYSLRFKPELGLEEFAGSKKNNIIWTGYGSHNFSPFKDADLYSMRFR